MVSDSDLTNGTDARHAGESAFTLLELIIVMSILAVLGGIGFSSFHGAKTNASTKETAASAGSYAMAIASFKLDHSGRVPIFGTAADWPVAADGPLMLTLGSNNQPNRYMRGGAPGAVADRRVVMAATAPAAQPATARGWLQYEQAANGRSFQLRTYTRSDPSEPWLVGCAYSDGALTAPAGTTVVPKACS